MKIKNIEDLRNHALNTLEHLYSGNIDTAEAGVTGKLCESVISTIKTELEYSRMIGKEPNIPFMGDFKKNKDLIVAPRRSNLLREPPK